MKVYPVHCERCGGEMALLGEIVAMKNMPAGLIYRCVSCRHAISVRLPRKKEKRTWQR